MYVCWWVAFYAFLNHFLLFSFALLLHILIVPSPLLLVFSHLKIYYYYFFFLPFAFHIFFLLFWKRFFTFCLAPFERFFHFFSKSFALAFFLILFWLFFCFAAFAYIHSYQHTYKPIRCRYAYGAVCSYPPQHWCCWRGCDGYVVASRYSFWLAILICCCLYVYARASILFCCCIWLRCYCQCHRFASSLYRRSWGCIDSCGSWLR